jgi:cation diffusion facilitator CzcD-associated flavoprotein CzcO/pimeloyl-ACP methyl ester carboxylesterase
MAEHVDVLIIGAGISGIGAACYLRRERPGTSFAILEARAATGGTWDLFRYPGIRSDSDLHTFGYEFKPWVNDKSIAGADAILAYVRETAAEHAIDRHIRLHHRVVGARWSSDAARWLVDIERTDTGARVQMTCRWLFSASGYYRYDQGFRPTFPGEERFRGAIVHPQHWPEDLDYTGKRVVVIGSGATAVTLVPAMTDRAAHVTMLQRTPSYVLPMPSEDALANRLRAVLPATWAYALTRRKNIRMQRTVWRLTRRFPHAARRVIRRINVAHLPPGYPVDTHFNPPYAVWDQRLCMVADGDLFRAIREGSASVVTDHIETFTERGILLRSGETLEADIIVTATGLNLQAFGGIELVVDGTPVRLPDTVAFKGMMLSGVPNFAFAIGYTNSSWTLKVGLLCEHFCRLLAHMDEHGHTTCVPEVKDPSMKTRPLLDFGAGYVKRAIGELPRQGERAPWLTSMDYESDRKLLRMDSVVDPELRFAGGARDHADRFCVVDGVRICYRTSGDRRGEPVVLIAGLGLDQTSWPESLIAALLARGAFVVTLDNRDVGRSARASSPPPTVLQQVLRRPRPDGYTLAHMARDTVGVLDALGLDDAHLVGMSMGGMIAQEIAARHPERVRSLTSIFSTTGARAVGQPEASTIRRLARRPARTRDQFVEGYVGMIRHIAGTHFPFEEQAVRAYAARAWDRGDGATSREGVARQVNAIQLSGDRTARLRRITAPTLVVHGLRDRMVAPSGGRATAEAIRGAKLVTIAGMEHYLAEGAIPRLVELIAEQLRAGQRSVRPAEIAV